MIRTLGGRLAAAVGSPRWAGLTALLALGLVPVALLESPDVPANPFGAAASGFNAAWLALGLVALVAAAVRVSAAVLRNAAPLALFVGWCAASLAWSDAQSEGLGMLLRYGAILAIYVAAWSTADQPWVLEVAPRLARLAVAISATAFVAIDLVGVGPEKFFPRRLMAMSLVALVVIAALDRPTAPVWVGVAASAVALAIVSGSRLATVALLVVTPLLPSRRPRVAVRLVAAAVMVAAFAAALSFGPLQERWFVRPAAASIADVLTFSDNVASSGRRAVWSGLAPYCMDAPWLGHGLGSANAAGQAINEMFPQPHNEYLRVFCDTGTVGSALFLGFIVAALSRAVRLARSRRPEEVFGWAAVLMIVGLSVLSAAENPLTATVQFAAPLAILLAWADRAHATRQGSPFYGASAESSSGVSRPHQHDAHSYAPDANASAG